DESLRGHPLKKKAKIDDRLYEDEILHNKSLEDEINNNSPTNTNDNNNNEVRNSVGSLPELFTTEDIISSEILVTSIIDAYREAAAEIDEVMQKAQVALIDVDKDEDEDNDAGLDEVKTSTENAVIINDASSAVMHE